MLFYRTRGSLLAFEISVSLYRILDRDNSTIENFKKRCRINSCDILGGGGVTLCKYRVFLSKLSVEICLRINFTAEVSALVCAPNR